MRLMALGNRALPLLRSSSRPPRSRSARGAGHVRWRNRRQPYAGLEARSDQSPVRAADQRLAGGPRHGLGAGGGAQRLSRADACARTGRFAWPCPTSSAHRIQALFAAMRAEAIPLGDKLIAQETDLDRQFAHKTISPASLAASIDAIGTTQAELRQAHLKYHLLTAEMLTPAQVRALRRTSRLHGRDAASAESALADVMQQMVQQIESDGDNCARTSSAYKRHGRILEIALR